MPGAKILIPAAELRTLVSGIFTGLGLSDADSATMAEVLVWANLRGIDSHGVSRVPRYAELFAKGEASTHPDVTVSRPRSAIVIVDAGGAPGPVAMSRAAREAVAAARETGVAWASVRGTVHTGAIGYYTGLIAGSGMAGIGIVAGVPNMAYAGSRGVAVATSPLSVAIPADRHGTVLLDMATAVVALGRLAEYKAAGQPLPAGIALTAEGEPTTDPKLAAIPLPVGGAKGAGMSLAFELLASGLVANPIVSSYHDGSPDGRRHRQNGALMALDIEAFTPVDGFRSMVDETVDALKALPRAQGADEILFPGERGARVLAERSRDGIPLGQKAWQGLREQAEQLGVPVPAAG
jgi:LDH2 family malate/lactate/ureidoglycolate dehydrogenase